MICLLTEIKVEQVADAIALNSAKKASRMPAGASPAPLKVHSKDSDGESVSRPPGPTFGACHILSQVGEAFGSAIGFARSRMSEVLLLLGKAAELLSPQPRIRSRTLQKLLQMFSAEGLLIP